MASSSSFTLSIAYAITSATTTRWPPAARLYSHIHVTYRSPPVARLHAAILGGSPQGEALEPHHPPLTTNHSAMQSIAEEGPLK